MAAPYLDFWFDFASTYSYPAIVRVGGLARREAVAVNFRPFLLGPIFKTQGWNTSPSTCFPPRAATCGATWNEHATRSDLSSGGRSHSLNRACLRRGLLWSVSARS